MARIKTSKILEAFDTLVMLNDEIRTARKRTGLNRVDIIRACGRDAANAVLYHRSGNKGGILIDTIHPSLLAEINKVCKLDLEDDAEIL